MRAILESYGKEILESASEQFLDLAVEVRLQTISARELVKLLAKANSLGIKRRTSSTTKMVPVLSRKALQIHDRSPMQSEPQSHRVRLLASVAFTPQLYLNYFQSKNLEP